MRYSNTSFLLLLVASVLLVADMAFGSPTFKIQHKGSIKAHTVSAPSSDNSNRYAVARMTTPERGSRNVRRVRDAADPANHHPSPALIQRHNYIMDHLQLHSDGSPLAKRSLAGDLTVMGFRLIWDQADVIVSSTLAYYHTTEYYKSITMLLSTEFEFGPTVQNYMITYGVFRLTFQIVANIAAEIASEIAQAFPNGFGQFIQGFAKEMLTITTTVVIGTYRILAYSAAAAIWLTMVIVENTPGRDMVIGRL